MLRPYKLQTDDTVRLVDRAEPDKEKQIGRVRKLFLATSAVDGVRTFVVPWATATEATIKRFKKEMAPRFLVDVSKTDGGHQLTVQRVQP